MRSVYILKCQAIYWHKGEYSRLKQVVYVLFNMNANFIYRIWSVYVFLYNFCA